MRSGGFTLVELMVSVAILAVISILLAYALSVSATSMSSATAETRVHNNLRNLLQVMQSEVELAAKEDDFTLTPPVRGISINTSTGDITVPVELTFQIPIDATGLGWSSPIIYRYVNEDLNGNGFLDSGEDRDSDKQLTQRLVRVQDLNGDGALMPNEVQSLGGVNNLDRVLFELAGTGNAELRVVVSSAVPVSNTQRRSAQGLEQRMARTQLATSILLLN